MKVVYLSSTELGQKMFEVLQTLNPEITFFTLENQKITDFDALDYDLGISFLYTHKIPASEFKKNKTWINFHPGPLPEYPGRNLCYHAIMDNASHFGATIHFMDENFDTGKIIEVLRFEIEPHFTAGDLSVISRQLLVALFEKYIPKLLTGSEVTSHPQEKHTHYFKQGVIDEEIRVSPEEARRILALTVSPRFYPYILINGQKFLIIPEHDAKRH